MMPRRYHPVWRILSGAISLAVLALIPGMVRGTVHAPDWGAAAGIVLVVVLLPVVAITGRAPRWLERTLRRDV